MFIPNVVAGPSRSRILANKDSSTVITAGTVLAYDVTTGLIVEATSATTRAKVAGIATEDISAGDALTQCGVLQIFENDTYVVDTTNNSDVADTGSRMLLTNSSTVNNTGTDDANGVVEQMATVGAASAKKIIVRFV